MSAVTVNSGTMNIVHTEKKGTYPAGNLEVHPHESIIKNDRILINNDVVIKDTVLNGTIIIEKDSRVVFENVVFYGDIYLYSGYSISPFLTIKDNAEVFIKNATFIIKQKGAFIGVYNNSKLTIEKASNVMEGVTISLYQSTYLNITDSACTFYISAFNSSQIYLKNITASTNIAGFNLCNIYVTDAIQGQFTMYLFNNATATFDAANGGNVISITQYQYSNSTIKDSDLGSYSSLSLNQHSTATITNSHVQSITTEDTSVIRIYDSSSNVINAYSSSNLLIDGGNYGSIYLWWGSRLKYTSAPGPKGILKNMNVNLVYTVSARILEIINSAITTLDYSNVHDGSYVSVDDTVGVNSSHWYVNYQSTGSTISLPILLSDTIVAVNLSTAIINSQAINRICTQNVENLSVYKTGSTIVSIHVWGSNAYIQNIAPDTLSIFSYNGNVIIQNLSTSTAFSLHAKGTPIHLSDGNLGGTVSVNISESDVFINNTSFNSGEVSFYNLSGHMESVYLNDVATEIYLLSNFTFNNVTILKYLDVMGSVVNATDTKINNATYEFILRDGEFNIGKGLIMGFTGKIYSGIYNHGNTNITGYYFVRGIVLDNVTLNMTKTTLQPGKMYVDITGGYIESMLPEEIKNISFVGILVANESTLYVYGLAPNASDTTLAILVVANSTASVANSNVTYLIADCSVYLNSSIVKNVTATYADIFIRGSTIEEMTLTYSNTTINSSSIDKINLVMGNLILYDCNVTSEINTGDVVAFVTNYSLFETNISIYDSNISTITSLSTGHLYIENTTAKYVLYAFQYVEIVNSTIDVLLNTSLVTAGPLIVNSNHIVYGNYENLLTLSGTNTIGLLEMCISARQDLMGETVNVTVTNSDIFGVVMSGGYLNIDNSNLIYVMTGTDKNISMKTTVINASVLSDKPIIMASYDLYMDNVNLIAERLIIGFSHTLIKDSTIYTDMLTIFNGTATISGTDIIPFNESTTVQAMFSDMTISDIYVSEFVLYFSSLDLFNSTISNTSRKESGIIMSFNSTLYAQNITADNIITKPVAVFWLYRYVAPAEIYTVKYVNAIVRDSTVTDLYALFYLTDNYYGVVFDNGTVTGDYDLKTNYTNSNISSASPIVLFEINDYAKAKILSYKNEYTIRSLWISCLTDTDPPEITALNDSIVEYEYGDDVKACYILDDVSPTNYTVSINGSEIMHDQYTPNYLLEVHLSAYISAPGTYIIEVQAHDSDLNSNSISTTVKVYPSENPEINLLNDTYIEYEYGAHLSVCFEIIEQFPSRYTVELNGTLIMNDSYTSGQTIKINLWEIIQAYGHYILHIEAYDKAGNVDTSDVEIEVFPAESPEITQKPEDTYNITQGESIVLSWTATDRSPDVYTIYINGEVNRTGKWTSGQKINLTFSTNTPGQYNITIVFTDKLGQKASHTVIINVIETTTTTTTPTTTGGTTTTSATITPTALPITYISAGILVVALLAMLLFFMKKKKQESQ